MPWKVTSPVRVELYPETASEALVAANSVVWWLSNLDEGKSITVERISDEDYALAKSPDAARFTRGDTGKE